MKIVLLTSLYSAERGGVATVSRLLVRELKKRNHEISVLTLEKYSGETDPIVCSCPSRLFLLKKIISSDAVILQGCILKLGWPLFFMRKRAVMVRHIEERKSPIRTWLERRCTLATVSQFMASHEAAPCHVLLNPYDKDVFFPSGCERDGDILFVGRLIEEKGVLSLLRAFNGLCAYGNYTLTIIGIGPQRSVCEEYVHEMNMTSNVVFLGHMDAPLVANQMRRHKVVVMPSIWEEPFGLVVLEGLACGCRIVASNRGGLPEALSGHGILYDPDDNEALVKALQSQLSQEPVVNGDLADHLDKHKPEAVVLEYEKLLFSEQD